MSKYFNKKQRRELCFNVMGENLGILQNFIQIRFEKIKYYNKYYLEVNVIKFTENKRRGFYKNISYDFRIFDKTNKLLKIRDRFLKINNFDILEKEFRSLPNKY